MAVPELKLKLLCHPRVDTKSRVSDDVLLHPCDNHGILPGNVIELKHPDVPQPTLFLVKSLREDFQHRDAISIEQSLAQSLKLQPYKTVSVRVVFKEKNTIVQRNTMVEFGVMRGYVGELWRNGELLSCGYISDRTKIIFRSSSATYHIFIQMSKEMWNFDEFGDLLFEKSIKFLRELVLKSWMNSFCTHDVTLVLATRAFISAPAIEIPAKSIFSRNSDGQIYADFYKQVLFSFYLYFVILQTERYSHEEWKRSFSQLMLAFKRYQSDIRDFLLKYLPGVIDPSHVSIRLSSSRETNLLESLNLVLSDYECYNVDRKFDQTGKACIMISSGCGVFDASRDMVSFTKQRTLDLGVTVDLVCLGHQPLHAVPLFICRDFENPESPEVCIVPHWLNHSYFRSSREIYALNHTETVTRINVKAMRIASPQHSVKTDEDQIVGRNEPHLPLYHRLRRQTITSVILPDQIESSRQRTLSFNDGLLIQSSVVMVERPMEGAISASEIGSYDSVSSTHVGWNITANLRSRTQSSLCSEQHSPFSGNVAGVDLLSEKPSWMNLYGHSDVESTYSNAFFSRNIPTLAEGPFRRRNQVVRHKDLSCSCQSGCGSGGEANLPHRSLVSHPGKTVIECPSSIGVAAECSASSWQPACGGEGVARHLPLASSRRSTTKKSSFRVKSTAAAIMGAAFRTFPFGIHPQIFGLNKTVSQRRLAYLHTAVQRMHLIKYGKTQCMQLLEGLRPKINLAKVYLPLFLFFFYIFPHPVVLRVHRVHRLLSNFFINACTLFFRGIS
uniref:DEP domain-containing protein n=1 Tax=Rodentolepis nana TaxID=102285 RepID=A0A0R3TBG1_RODNA